MHLKRAGPRDRCLPPLSLEVGWPALVVVAGGVEPIDGEHLVDGCPATACGGRVNACVGDAAPVLDRGNGAQLSRAQIAPYDDSGGPDVKDAAHIVAKALITSIQFNSTDTHSVCDRWGGSMTVAPSVRRGGPSIRHGQSCDMR